MLRTPLFTALALLMLAPFASAQNDCNEGSFYGMGDGKIYRLTLSGGTITLGPIVNSQVAGLNGLALGDLGNGHTFYSTDNPGEIKEWSGSAWQTVHTDNLYRANCGGRAGHVYFQQLRLINPDPTFQNRIEHFDGTAPTLIWNDQSVFQPVADVAVDQNGNVYFFTGSSAFDVSHLNIMSPAGVILASLPIAFEGLNGFGAFLMGDKLYLAFGPSNSTYPGQLVPITIAGGAATLGTPVAIPSPVIGTSTNGPIYLLFTDLEGCAPVTIDLSTALQENAAPALSLAYDPALEQLRFNVMEPGARAIVRDELGRALIAQRLQGANSAVSLSALPAGVYIVEVHDAQGTRAERVVKGW